ncbi:Mitochondrial inner membrane protease atp23 [Ceratobasidium sp. UAMH 11750]|nr:Mitochondrial inner membrane protease atp23 [Ceratobasidium sp. UAMH 11750]
MSTSTSSSSSTVPESLFRSTKEASAFERWRTSLTHFTGLGLSEEDKAKRDKLKGLELEESQWRRCETWKSDLMKNSPVVVFMMKHLALEGANVSPNHIHCSPCDATRAGGFSPEAGVLLCQDRFLSKSHMQDTLVHELVHMYDHAKFKVDWNNLRHHACSEIRAASLSGDCRWSRETQRGFVTFSKQHQACARRRAILSVIANPACKSPEDAERAVNEVWESCFKDTRPFDEIY